jgi:hypothetical protein
MFEAGTKGGPVPLEADSLQLRFIMDRVCGKVPRWDTLKALATTAPRPIRLDGWHTIWALLKLDEITKKYLLIGVSEYVQQLIINYAEQNPPAILLHACQSSPINDRMAFAALKAFRDEMPIWMNQYFEDSLYDPRKDPAERHFFSPEATNLRQDFVEALGLRVFFAYPRALKEGTDPDPVLAALNDTLAKHAGYDWNVVAKRFMATMSIPQHLRSWPLRHDKDDAASDWSTNLTIISRRSEHSSGGSIASRDRLPEALMELQEFEDYGIRPGSLDI